MWVATDDGACAARSLAVAAVCSDHPLHKVDEGGYIIDKFQFAQDAMPHALSKMSHLIEVAEVRPHTLN